MKNIIVFICLFFCLLFITKQLNAQSIKVRIPDTTFVKGAFINMPIYLDSSVSGKGVYSYQFKINYASNYLNFVEIITNNTLSNSFVTPLATLKNGIISFSSYGFAPLNGSGVLLFLRFKVLEAGSSYLNFGSANECMLNEGNPSLNLFNSYIFIYQAPSISCYLANNEPITIGENLQLNTYGGNGPYTFKVLDSTLASINSNGLITALNAGKTKVIAQSSEGLIDTTDNFLVIRSLKLAFSDTLILPVQSAIFPLRINNINGFNILSGSFRITFNPQALTFDTIILSNCLLQNFFVSHKVYNGYIDFSFANSIPLSGFGDFIKLKFKVLNSGTNYLTTQNVVFNQDVLVNGRSSSISYIQLAGLSISPQSGEIYSGDSIQFSSYNGVPTILFNVSDTFKATINSSGLLKAKKGGIIKVGVQDGIGRTISSDNFQIYDGLVELPNIEVPIGRTFSYPVSLTHFFGNQPIYSIQISLTYNSENFDSIKVSLANGICSSWFISQRIQNNKIVLAIASSTPILTSGIIFKLEGKLNNNFSVGNASYFYTSSCLINEGAFIPKLSSGRISVLPPPGVLNVKVFFEGLYLGDSKMTPALNNWDSDLPALFADSIVVGLYNTYNFQAVYTSTGLVDTLGNSVVEFPASFIGNSFYISIKHRNSIETWSSSAPVFSASNSYNFSNAKTQAYGENMKNDGSGVYLIFSGDINQDGSIDFLDYPEIDYASVNGFIGYLNSDLNGDSSVDFLDYPAIDQNSLDGIISAHP
jgi:hypothetical protein